MERLTVKVCGMRDGENIREVERLGIDWMGFIFYPKSSRFVDSVPAYLPVSVRRVGVFVNAAPEYILDKVKRFSLGAVQLHGHETPENVLQIKNRLPSGTLVVKALNIGSPEDLAPAAAYGRMVDFFLFDTKASLAGGNGTKFDWNVLSSYNGSTPFILSGGIGPDDAEKVLSFSHPMLRGIDLNRRFEISPGMKDPVLLEGFLKALHGTI